MFFIFCSLEQHEIRHGVIVLAVQDVVQDVASQGKPDSKPKSKSSPPPAAGAAITT